MTTHSSFSTGSRIRTKSNKGARQARWLVPPGVALAEQAPTLVCIPHAGAGPAVYREFVALLAPQIGLHIVHLPGREARLGEPAADRLPTVVRDLVPHLVPALRGRFALWGHSMGAYVAFEVARVLEARFGQRPEALVVSGCQAPQSPSRAQLPQRRLMSDEEVWDSAADLNGMPDQISHNPELRALLLPTLRADFTVFESYRYQPGILLNCPIVAVGGSSDAEAPEADMILWEKETQGRFDFVGMDGGHFFHLADSAGFSGMLREELEVE